jgi:hypothetical protein
MDIMLDFETLDTGPFPALLSVGAVAFDPTAPADVDIDPAGADCFFREVDAQSCIDRGASVSRRTLQWWVHPDRAAGREHILTDAARPVHQVIAQLIGWASTYATTDSCLWSHGLLADAAWLGSYLTTCGYSWPGGIFSYRQMRDTRTVYALAQGHRFFDQAKPTIAHHPLHDCIAQVKNLRYARKVLGL